MHATCACETAENVMPAIQDIVCRCCGSQLGGAAPSAPQAGPSYVASHVTQMRSKICFPMLRASCSSLNLSTLTQLRAIQCGVKPRCHEQLRRSPPVFLSIRRPLALWPPGDPLKLLWHLIIPTGARQRCSLPQNPHANSWRMRQCSNINRRRFTICPAAYIFDSGSGSAVAHAPGV